MFGPDRQAHAMLYSWLGEDSICVPDLFFHLPENVFFGYSTIMFRSRLEEDKQPFNGVCVFLFW
jgi:hypothetical protein